ncbi:hypothetical protein GOP47_0025203 [Adiantum capillus-veneris]|uniref:CCHC-type domain-containing protein n=1 Tax=Adiantum capillus-veneris TaxID=13818 RepID=A0A9D4U4D1_ADICA|nr:hypothetical protein GOP47_0025203 [Adiantum capillus-veneris]
MGDKGIEKFNGEGFHTWQTKLRGYLMKKCLWSVISIALEKQAEPDGVHTRASTLKASAQYLAKDEQALGIIITSLHDNYVHFIDECTHAHDAWNVLESNFVAKAKRSKVSLKRQLYKITMIEEGDIASLVNRLKSTVMLLTYIQVEVPQDDKVAILLSALPPSYDYLVTILEEKEPPPPFQDVINSVQAEERKQRGSLTPSGGAFLTTSSRGRHSPSTSSTGRKCYECGRMGDVEKDCYTNNPCNKCGKKEHPPSQCYSNGGRSSEKAALAEATKARDLPKDQLT